LDEPMVHIELGADVYIFDQTIKDDLEKLNFLPVDKQMTADAIVELNSFHEMRLALSDCRIV
nr:hypothetical protein [Tanacetum cinerariifolium]